MEKGEVTFSYNASRKKKHYCTLLMYFKGKKVPSRSCISYGFFAHIYPVLLHLKTAGLYEKEGFKTCVLKHVIYSKIFLTFCSGKRGFGRSE